MTESDTDKDREPLLTHGSIVQMISKSALRTGCAGCGAARKDVVDQADGVGDVDVGTAVGIAGEQWIRRGSTGEDVVDQEDRIGNRDEPGAIGITALVLQILDNQVVFEGAVATVETSGHEDIS